MEAGARPAPVPTPRDAWRSAAASIVAAAISALAIASCAPHRAAPPPLEPHRLAARYRVRLAAREALARAVDAEASAWLKGDSLDLPGVHARVALGAPDAFRVRVESLFGVALDFAAWGDSLACFVPSRRLGLALDAAADSIGVRSPGSLGARLLAAIWDPPPAAWDATAGVDSLVVVGWREGGDSLALGVGSDGTPRWVELLDAFGNGARARYRRWETVHGTPWPVHVEIADRSRRLTLAIRLSHVSRNATPGRLMVRIPRDAGRLEWISLREAIARGRRL